MIPPPESLSFPALKIALFHRVLPGGPGKWFPMWGSFLQIRVIVSRFSSVPFS
jgi:hypothetical protein